MSIYNFSAGPSILPKSVFEQASEAVINFNNTGLSILEISHRSKSFISVMEEAESLVREILEISQEYAILFLSGGASTQFFMAPMNLLDQHDKAAYADTGTWAAKAIKEAKQFGHVDIITSSKSNNYNYIPIINKLTDSYRYLHITTNNTIFGTQYHTLPKVNIPLVADMSSDIFSKPINIEKFDLIYAGAQKNFGPAGTTLVIVKKEILGKVKRSIPAMLDYRNHIENGSMYNTPPVFSIYVAMLTLRWIKQQGGVSVMQKKSVEKAELLYSEIERNSKFYCPVQENDRSHMNICFLTKSPEDEEKFLKLSKSSGCDGLAGHRSVGGFRASVYNAMPKEGVLHLIKTMQEFEAGHS